VIEMFGAAAVAYTLARAEPGRERNTVIFAVGGIGVMEALWAIGQRLQNGPLGLQRFGESSDPFYRAFGTPAPQGSMVHIYVLAGLGLLAGAFLIWAASEMARPRVWLVAAAIAISSVGFTYSRAGALGLLLLVGAVVVAGYPPLRRRSLAMTAALVIGAGVPALIWSGGWTTRASQTTSAATSAALTTDRGHLLGQAVHIIEHNPILGVGPGRYATAVRDRFGSRPINYRAVFQPVHNIPTLAAAEGGVLAGVVVAATFIALGWRALRSGALPTAVFLCYLPFFMLDQFAYAFPQGIVMTGLWLGAVDALTRRPAALSAGH
jgi:O-antigen ligase